MKTRHIFLSILIASALQLSACVPSANINTIQSDQRRQTDPSVNESDVKVLVDGNNAFALDLYKSLRPQDGNLVYSPFSISLALAMMYAGARNETEAQMAQTLHFPPQQKLHPAFNALDLKLTEEHKVETKDQNPLQLNIANAIWAEQTYHFQQDFLDTIALNYGAGINLSDFIHQFDAARKEINGWISNQTNAKIKDLIPEGSLNADTRMVLVNAIYFKADWLNQFDAKSTQEHPFHLLNGSTVSIPTMFRKMNIPYAQGDGYQAAELPYAGNTAAMDIILPDNGKFAEIESALNADILNNIMNSMQVTPISFGMPKFKFYGSFGLSEELKTLGMPDAFDSDKADFSGMTGKPELFISDVIHKALIAVDEKGTEAAAATAVIMEATSALRNQDISMIVDRPFIFVIRDLSTSQILFIGRVSNPAQ